MSDLLKTQLQIIGVMGAGGITAGLVYDVFESFIAVRRLRRLGRWLTELLAFTCIGVMSGEFLYSCDHGKLTFLSICAFAAGLILYKKIICDTMSLSQRLRSESERRVDERQVPERR